MKKLFLTFGIMAAALQATAVMPASAATVAKPGVATVSLTRCVNAAEQSDRAVSFAAKMTAKRRGLKLAMHFDLQKKAEGEADFSTLSVPALEGWREAKAGVRSYKLKQTFTNLSAPASYRASITFRWSNSKTDAVVKKVKRISEVCEQS